MRLKPGVTLEQAQAEVSAMPRGSRRRIPRPTADAASTLFPLWQTPFNDAGALLPTLGIALVVVLSVLLIACANVGNLLLVRAFARQQEMTIRLSIGAGRGRLVRQLLTEGLILSAFAAAGGLVVASWLRDALCAVDAAARWRGVAACRARSTGASRAERRRLSGVDAAVRLGARHSDRATIDLAGALRSQSGGVVGARGRSWVRSALVLVQMSLSFVLLVGAALLIRSLRCRSQRQSGLFDAGRADDVGRSVHGGLRRPAREGFSRTSSSIVCGDRRRRVGGLVAADAVPYRSYSSAPIAVDGYDAPPDQQPTAEYNEIGPDSFPQRWGSRC